MLQIISIKLEMYTSKSKPRFPWIYGFKDYWSKDTFRKITFPSSNPSESSYIWIVLTVFKFILISRTLVCLLNCKYRECKSITRHHCHFWQHLSEGQNTHPFSFLKKQQQISSISLCSYVLFIGKAPLCWKLLMST